MTDPYSVPRAQMVRDQLARRGIGDVRVLEAMGRIPRERFLRRLSPQVRSDPYADSAQPIGRGQTLSQPYIVAAMTEALGLTEGARVLEIGTGTGYQTAVLANIAGEVWTVERDPVLAAEARKRLSDLGLENVRFRVGDGSLGWEEGSPYSAILVTAGAPDIPDSLTDQLAVGGHLVIPVGSTRSQRLMRVTRSSDGESTTTKRLMDCRFVPLIGKEGWQGADGSPPDEAP